MSFKTTLLLLLLVTALGVTILGVERFLPSTRELLEMKRGPAKFDRTKVTQVDIDSSGGEGVSLALEGGRWWVRRPFNDLADPEKITKLIQDLSAIGWIERVHRSEFDDAGWARTGLHQPPHKLRLMAGGERVLECWVGSRSPIEGSHYLALVPTEGSEEPAYYVVKTDLPDHLKAAPKDWRDSKLLRLPANLVTGLKLTQAGGQIELSRKDEKSPWMFVKPLNTRGSKERIGELVSTLLNLEVKDAVEPVNGAAAKEPAAGSDELAASDLKVTVTVKGSEAAPYEMILKKPEANAQETTATISSRKPLFTVLSKSLNDLWAQPNDLRDRMLARIDEDAVQEIHISSVNFPPVNLRKEAESWFVERHGEPQPANGDRVARFFDALNTYAILEFTADSASNLALYGLDNPFLTVSWTEHNAKPMKLTFGKNAEATEFFAKYEQEPCVYRVDASLLPLIPQDSIKWRGLGALRFTQFALRRISLSAGTGPPVVLNYDPTTAQWAGEQADRNITPLIDRVKADRLAGMLAKFTVQDWVADRTNALAALKDPAFRVVVTLGEPGTNTGPTRHMVISFAPTQHGADSTFYFGQVEGNPDVFYVTRSSLLELLASVLKEA